LVRSLHCSGNGKFLVSGNGWPAAKPAICLWDIATGKPVRELNGGFLASCFFSSDGRTLFFSRGDAAVRRYDLVEAREIALGLAATKSVVFSPDGEHFAAGGTHLYLCSAASGKILRRLAGHSNGIYSVVFSPDGASLVSAGRDGTIRFWDVQSGKEKQRLEGHKGQRGEPAWINAVAFSPDGKLLADAARDNSVRIWDVAAAKEIHKFTLAPWTGPGGAPSFAYALAFAPNGKTIALAGPGNGITILEQVSDQWSMRSIEGHQSVVEGVAFSPDGATLASTALDGTIRLWDPATGRQVRRFQEPPGWSIRKQLHRDGRSLAFSPDGKSLACGSWQSTCVWELATGQERKLGGHLGEVVSVAFSPDSRKLATCSFDTTVMLWDLNGP
jgi:WD40 repeat protein